jgi:acyl-CoA thioesterase-1
MKIVSLLSALAAVLGLAPFQTAQAAKRDASKVITIVALGDSLTEGFGLSRKQAYPALIAEKMRRENYEFEVVNAGWSGDTTAGGLRRLPEVLRTRKKIDIFILALGINDAFRGVPIEQMRSNLQAIIDRTRARHPDVTVIIAGMQLPLVSSDGYVRAFGEMFGALAEKNRAALIPYLLEGVGGDPELNLPDRIHPNAAGQRILAENVWRVLEPILRGIKERRLKTAAPWISNSRSRGFTHTQARSTEPSSGRYANPRSGAVP